MKRAGAIGSLDLAFEMLAAQVLGKGKPSRFAKSTRFVDSRRGNALAS